MERAKRYLVFLVGLFINAMGVSLITKADLGTSPISSIPYVLSLNLPLTLGEFTILFSLFLIVLQLLILRKNFKLEYWLQVPVSVAFGYFIDLGMLLLGFVHPQVYLWKVVYLLLGCLILGAGVFLEVIADVVMLPGESFVRAIVFQWKTEFGLTKVAFDMSMTIIAAILSFGFRGQLSGVREGTVVAAVLVGFIARLMGRKLGFLSGILFGKSPLPLLKARREPIPFVWPSIDSMEAEVGKSVWRCPKSWAFLFMTGRLSNWPRNPRAIPRNTSPRERNGRRERSCRIWPLKCTATPTRRRRPATPSLRRK